MDFFQLRQKHPALEYRGFDFERIGKNLLINFNLFLEPDISFQAKVKFLDLPKTAFEKIENDQTVETLFQNLGLAELASYWKAACPAKIKIATALTAKQKDFWQDLMLNGLTEFYYQNQIDFTQENFLEIEAAKAAEIKTPLNTNSNKKVSRSLENKKLLVPVGGGKDSATLLGILESKKLDYNILLLSPLSPAAKAIAVLLKNEGHCQNIIEVERSIDPKLLKLNQIGYLNGHTPFSAYLAFLSVTVAYLYGHDLVLLSNESSADEENTIFHGRKVNHQYSKSSEFEKKFQDYSQEFLFDKSEQKPFYFSLLRPLSELQIAKTLVQLARNDKNFKKILSIFRSCNVGQKQGIWCHNCPKCAFVFTIFSAFLEPDFVSEQIFRKNLFEKESLRETFFELAGLRDKKPFECVGTFAETREAISLASKQYQEKNLPLPKTLADLQQSLKETRMNQDAK